MAAHDNLASISIPANKSMDNAKTLCVKRCELAPNRLFCTGCGRSLEEIKEAGLKQKEVHHRYQRSSTT